ncbi:MAG: phosphoenolpyruvate synthase [Candidatus Melainabacteria bacterium]|jgi:pyruvate,water dikinase|nr:phosphoenolpyruvate synthase [Candidatus Melainabacteria bacterium]
MEKFILPFNKIALSDIAKVGGKNASLGEMTCSMADLGIAVPGGFAITVDAYDALLDQGNLRQELENVFLQPLTSNLEDLRKRSQTSRELIRKAGIPANVKESIVRAYRDLSREYDCDAVDVAVRSSATAEDLPDASFAGQQESFLNVQGEEALLSACLDCFASLFTERAISYRHDKGFEQMGVKLSIGVQKMIRSDLASSGVIFTLDTESGFRDAVLITSAFGLGENVVGGKVDPDEFLVFKTTLKQGFKAILRRKVGLKQQRLVYASHGTRKTENLIVPDELRKELSLSDEEATVLAHWAILIEEHYSKRAKRPMAMDIEWAKDGLSQRLYIVQARPETVISTKKATSLTTYALKEKGELLLQGRAIGDHIGAGRVRLIRSKNELPSFQEGEVLVADMTDPDWEPVMKRAAGIITNRGGRTCHAAIVSRELGVPCIVGTEVATKLLSAEAEVTVSCAEGSEGKVYAGLLKYEKTVLNIDELPKTRTKIMLNLADPDQAFALSQLPVDGVGLAREEFVIANEVKVHPLALTRFGELHESAKESVKSITSNYTNRTDYFVDKLAEGIGTIAAAFYPRAVIVRLSDFKTNEYGNLLGGAQFEPKEDNPMLGFRGASRYYSKAYKDGFALECRALKFIRDDMGLTNVKIMVPFCRTVEEGRLVIKELAENGLQQGENGLEIYVMCEIPSNVILAEEFAQIFDGFSIGSNDLTQLVLGVDRDSKDIANLFDERNPAVRKMIASVVKEAKRAGRKIGICGQAPSDYPEFAEFLVEAGIDSMSLSADAVVKTIRLVHQKEESSQGLLQQSGTK